MKVTISKVTIIFILLYIVLKVMINYYFFKVFGKLLSVLVSIREGNEVSPRLSINEDDGLKKTYRYH